MMEPTPFMDRVLPEPNSGCWLWTGCVSKYGYGQVRRNGKMQKAHRVSYEMHIGEIPDGMCVCHTCDVRSCVNPGHLFLGTHADNMRDMAAKGRASAHAVGVPGEAHWNAKLTDAQVSEIRAKIASGAKQRDIAAEYGVSQSHVSRIHQGKFWGHVVRC